eukprot:GHVS01067815.1.p1 GENE.GHVS01067815.1~~GHVS01067815.1.p1  ORF type:complete len:335 (+),score=48.34 GHVS01067815.1:120-1124(+)
MEDKMLQGSQVMYQAMLQQQELKRTQIELEERRRREKTLSVAMERREEERQAFYEEKYTSQNESLDKLMTKLTKVWEEYRAATNEISDLHQEFQQEREDLLQTIRSLTKELKLKNVVITHFVPQSEYQRIESKAVWDPDENSWMIPKLQFAGNNTVRERPMSASPHISSRRDLTKIRCAQMHGQLAASSLEPPERTTVDWADVQGQRRLPSSIEDSLDVSLNTLDDSRPSQQPSQTAVTQSYSSSSERGARQGDRKKGKTTVGKKSKRSDKSEGLVCGKNSQRQRAVPRAGLLLPGAAFDPMGSIREKEDSDEQLETSPDPAETFPRARGLVAR